VTRGLVVLLAQVAVAVAVTVGVGIMFSRHPSTTAERIQRPAPTRAASPSVKRPEDPRLKWSDTTPLVPPAPRPARQPPDKHKAYAPATTLSTFELLCLNAKGTFTTCSSR